MAPFRNRFGEVVGQKNGSAKNGHGKFHGYDHLTLERAKPNAQTTNLFGEGTNGLSAAEILARQAATDKWAEFEVKQKHAAEETARKEYMEKKNGTNGANGHAQLQAPGEVDVVSQFADEIVAGATEQKLDGLPKLQFAAAHILMRTANPDEISSVVNALVARGFDGAALTGAVSAQMQAHGQAPQPQQAPKKTGLLVALGILGAGIAGVAIYAATRGNSRSPLFEDEPDDSEEADAD